VTDDGNSFQFLSIKANQQRPPKIVLHAKCMLGPGDGYGASVDLEVTVDQKMKNVSIDCSGCDLGKSYALTIGILIRKSSF
jgi:hypothetical protein